MTHNPKPGDRVRILKGEHAGKEGRVGATASNSYSSLYGVLLDHDPMVRAFPPDCLGPVEAPRRVPLLEYLDKLEATAKAADVETGGAEWHHAKDAGRIFTRDPKDPTVRRNAVAATMYSRDACADSIVATQPKATLALIAKLREYHKRLADLCNEIAQSSEDPDDLDDVRRFLRDGIEVPE